MRDGRAALLCVLLAACSYDWAPGAAGTPADGGGDAEAGVVDAHDTDAASDAPAPAVDAPGVDSPGPADAPVVDVVAEVDCAALQNAVQAALPPALTCQGEPPDPTACTTAVQDPCKCTLYVGAAGAATSSYENAVKALQDSGCTLDCSGTCPVAQKSLCLVTDAGGQQYACYE
jgi:hypothetical protein